MHLSFETFRNILITVCKWPFKLGSSKNQKSRLISHFKEISSVSKVFFIYLKLFVHTVPTCKNDSEKHSASNYSKYFVVIRHYFQSWTFSPSPSKCCKNFMNLKQKKRLKQKELICRADKQCMLFSAVEFLFRFYHVKNKITFCSLLWCSCRYNLEFWLNFKRCRSRIFLRLNFSNNLKLLMQ